MKIDDEQKNINTVASEQATSRSWCDHVASGLPAVQTSQQLAILPSPENSQARLVVKETEKKASLFWKNHPSWSLACLVDLLQLTVLNPVIVLAFAAPS